ncbi:hypothetical protein CAOG_06019 [Capsaspora owczarzaki ATCC 30864]|uniref:NOD3 protein n=1 Tax=Capsaspora owczarzaki (strain ATCC 30864) TaxID=595528 RepID=A0A0D2X477_CAPO3|nr:hypothetical protein CAOG_06019 [Capsaspora owczarzaki ATCC 30864]KJE95579.1 hypothetical protein CAOG_006019 [Capsaspora owczarzaki ATCC 30864]|eukprot:XP_004345609.1 hypothetical protein CAOG_06019 [Capsaspora owczarzaki ATCC 30864]
MLSYESMTERQRELYDQVKNADGELHLNCKQIGVAEAQAIAEALKVNRTLTDLNLNVNLIGDAGAQAIAEALKVNTTLTVLFLGGTQIGDIGALAIAEALKVNTTLTALSLGNNQIGDAGAQAFAEALKANTMLTELTLDWNQIGDAGAQAFAEALKANTTLTQLQLDFNQIGEVGMQAIAEALQVNKTLTLLYLKENRFGDVGAQAIAEALKVNTTLTELRLNDNQIGDGGACAIAEALKVNKTVTRLSLDRNCIGSVGSQAFDEARKGNCRCQVDVRDQINPLAFSLLPRLASAEDIQAVLGMLTGGLELENQPVYLPALPTEIAELIMEEAHYWQGVAKTNRRTTKVTVPQGDSIRVKVIQVVRFWRERPSITGYWVFNLTVRDEQGAVRHECTVHPTFVESNLALATFWPASHPIIRQMREGWQVQASVTSNNMMCESLYVGYVDRQ